MTTAGCDPYEPDRNSGGPVMHGTNHVDRPTDARKDTIYLDSNVVDTGAARRPGIK